MNTSSMLVRAGAVTLIVLAAGCSSTNWPRMSGSGNQTSYATGSYPMPPKTAANTANANARANGDATGADTRTRTAGPTDTSTVMAAEQALAKFGYNPGNADGTFDANTRAAVMNFQKERGLQATGDLDAATLSALGVPPRQ